VGAVEDIFDWEAFQVVEVENPTSEIARYLSEKVSS